MATKVLVTEVPMLVPMMMGTASWTVNTAVGRTEDLHHHEPHHHPHYTTLLSLSQTRSTVA
jgi:hypothetical protein